MDTRHLPKGHTMSTIDRAAEVIDAWTKQGHELNSHVGDPASIARNLADAGRLRPDPSSRYDDQYRTSFCRDEEAGDGPYIEASLSTHHPAPERKIVHRADVSIDIGGEHGYHILSAYATAEWCREAAAILLDVADEVDRKNKETTENEGTDE